MSFAALIDQVRTINSLQNVAAFKQAVNDCYTYMEKSFPTALVDDLVIGRSNFVDALVTHAWQLAGLHEYKKLTLVAVGGYGRGQLQPHSDVDLLILSHRGLPRGAADKISAFLTLLWDAKLDVGSAVRSIKECIEQAKNDITIATNIVEARCLTGCKATFDTMITKVNREKTWTSKAFFMAKYEEQQLRHSKFNGTSYNLEPNVKENPGCLRDIQSIGWVAKNTFKNMTVMN